MRTKQEIISRIKSPPSDDMFGWQTDILLPFLAYEDLAENFDQIAEKYVAEDWNSDVHTEYTRDNVIKEMRDYMDFAVNKAINHRGLSSVRSIDHYHGWVWLLGHEEYERIWPEIQAKGYRYYGAPMLVAICKEFEFTGVDQFNDPGFQRMAEGLPCEPNCDWGCEA